MVFCKYLGAGLSWIKKHPKRSSNLTADQESALNDVAVHTLIENMGRPDMSARGFASRNRGLDRL